MSRGGARKGAGRPALAAGKKKVGVYVKLPPDLIAWMDGQPESRAVIIEKAVREKYGVHPAD
jgi:hypothetical protein